MQLTCVCSLLYFKMKPITPNNASLIVRYLPLYHRTSPHPLWNSLYGVDLLLPYIRFASVLPFLQSLPCIRVFQFSTYIVRGWRGAWYLLYSLQKCATNASSPGGDAPPIRQTNCNLQNSTKRFIMP